MSYTQAGHLLLLAITLLLAVVAAQYSADDEPSSGYRPPMLALRRLHTGSQGYPRPLFPKRAQSWSDMLTDDFAPSGGNGGSSGFMNYKGLRG
uniref:Neuropeptide-Like Protein n=1 Tax=Panagrellus redivivus TaxID=6233 RepID=A0A7E4ZW49_PANRE